MHMAIIDRKMTLSGLASSRGRRLKAAADIDAKEFDRARKDPVVRRFAATADAHLRRLRAEGRIN
jgi:hypothetical protein